MTTVVDRTERRPDRADRANGPINEGDLMRSILGVVSVLVLFGTFQACTCNNTGVNNNPDLFWNGDGPPPWADLAVTIPGADGGMIVFLDGGRICVTAPCQGKLYQCGNCMDDDGDGLIDSE